MTNSFFFPNVDPIYLFKRAGTTEDPFIPIAQDLTVKFSKVTLKEIPSYIKKVVVTGTGTYTEVVKSNLTEYEYRVDYSTGVVYFNENQEDKTLKFAYDGIGQLDIPASRMIVNTSDENAEGITVQDIIDASTKVANVKELVEQAQIVNIADYKADMNEFIPRLADISIQLKLMGAKLDGVTDDTTVINAYINQIPAAGKTRTVLLPDTTVAISTLNITTPNILLKGGNNTVLKKKTGSVTTQDFINVQADNVTIENIEFDDNGISCGYLINANYNQSVPRKNIKIRDIRFTAKANNSRGIMVGYYDGVEISKCKLENTNDTPNSYSFGIGVWSQKDIGDNTMMTKNIHIHHNHIIGFSMGINSWGTGIGASGNRQRMFIDNNIVEKSYESGIYAYHAPRSTIYNNLVRNCKDLGIWSDSGNDYEYAYSDSTQGYGNRVIGNLVYGCRVGILTEEFRYGVISNNAIFQCTDYGIGLGGGTDSSVINHNTILENGYGIYADKNINPNTYFIFDLEISGNIIKRNKYHGVRLGGVKKTVKINGGFITDNGTANIGVSSPATVYSGIWMGKDGANADGSNNGEIRITDVEITNNYNYAAGLTEAGAQAYGIYVQQGSTNKLTIRTTVLAGHTTNHIYATFVTGGLTIQNTSFLTTNVGNNINGSVVTTSGNVGLLTEYRNNNGNFILDGKYNTDHLVLNGNHLWVEGGRLYFKSSAPASATDGSLVSLVFANNNRLSTDPITAFPVQSIERCEIGGSNSTVANFPNGSSGTLITYRGIGDLYSYQEYHIRQSVMIFKRFWNTSTSDWSAWSKISAV